MEIWVICNNTHMPEVRLSRVPSLQNLTAGQESRKSSLRDFLSLVRFSGIRSVRPYIHQLKCYICINQYFCFNKQTDYYPQCESFCLLWKTQQIISIQPSKNVFVSFDVAANKSHLQWIKHIEGLRHLSICLVSLLEMTYLLQGMSVSHEEMMCRCYRRVTWAWMSWGRLEAAQSCRRQFYLWQSVDGKYD